MLSDIKIERVDNLPIIVMWLLKMRVNEFIDSIWNPHGNWQGLSYGQLAVLFIAYVIQRRTHTLSKMEDWLETHRQVLVELTGWEVQAKDGTDDRLGLLLDSLGENDEQIYAFQKILSQEQIQAFALPTKVVRYDTTSFSVHHAPPTGDETKHELLRFGYSKDHRPDLLQFKQGLGTLDPAGVPLVTHTLAGNQDDDGLYIPAWIQMAEIIGHTNFLFVADCKAGSQNTRATIHDKGGHYLFPLPLTGETPEWLQTQVNSQKASTIVLPEILDKKGNPKVHGEGFAVPVKRHTELDDGQTVTWDEQCFVIQSYAHAKRQKQAIQERVQRTKLALERIRPKQDESIEAFQLRADNVLRQNRTASFFTLTATEQTITRKRYLRRGRPGPKTPFEMVEEHKLVLQIAQDDNAIDSARQLAGWRVFVNNSPSEQFSITDAILHYREEWQVEHGMHRFKKGSLPVPPLSVRLPDRIKGLMLLLFVALQALTLIEFVARRSLMQQKIAIAGLVPGNPTRSTTRPTAERILAAFEPLHLVIRQTSDGTVSFLNETLSKIQMQILELLELPPDIYFIRNGST